MSAARSTSPSSTASRRTSTSSRSITSAKRRARTKKPTSLADVYGSAWITAGAGSVLLLWGQPGDPIVELTHLKQPALEVGPLTVVHDHVTGTSRLHEPVDLRAIVAAATNGGLTATDAARQLFSVTDPDRNQIERARRRLRDLVSRGEAVENKGDGRTDPVHFRPVEREGSVKRVKLSVKPSRSQQPNAGLGSVPYHATLHAPSTHYTDSSQVPLSPLRGSGDVSVKRAPA